MVVLQAVVAPALQALLPAVRLAELPVVHDDVLVVHAEHGSRPMDVKSDRWFAVCAVCRVPASSMRVTRRGSERVVRTAGCLRVVILRFPPEMVVSAWYRWGRLWHTVRGMMGAATSLSFFVHTRLAATRTTWVAARGWRSQHGSGGSAQGWSSFQGALPDFDKYKPDPVEGGVDSKVLCDSIPLCVSLPPWIRLKSGCNSSHS